MKEVTSIVTNDSLAKASVDMCKKLQEHGYRPSEALLLLMNTAFAVYRASNLCKEVEGIDPAEITFDSFITKAQDIYNASVMMNVGGRQ
jgi:light-regulated signal transduction histidine kinase (bacteriophytochrome)